MSTEMTRHALNGATMGTRWSALFHSSDIDAGEVTAACQSAVDDIDAQMSTWRPDSDLMRLNTAEVGAWVAVPEHLLSVLLLGLEVGRASGGAFDISMGRAVDAWGFGAKSADEAAILAAMQETLQPADALEIDSGAARVRKHRDVQFDLNGIAKGYGVDRLAETLGEFGIADGLVGIDGELRALGTQPNGEGWTVAVEMPDVKRRSIHSILTLETGAVATSGDYRHWIAVGGRRLSHTMDPTRNAPLIASPASVTVVAETCATADAWATAMMVLGPDAGTHLAAKYGLNVLFLLRGDNGDIHAKQVGPLFAETGAANDVAGV
ncbi:MAG: FAD:protein FMN transferase [Pseudomonadota bacterium]|nr:FAD:protein FMN transferase [Pseudomonadota bacterium]